jgi:hypothetical protein
VKSDQRRKLPITFRTSEHTALSDAKSLPLFKQLSEGGEVASLYIACIQNRRQRRPISGDIPTSLHHSVVRNTEASQASWWTIGFIQGRVTEEMHRDELDKTDSRFPVIIAAHVQNEGFA